MMNKHRGFTLMEIIVTFAIIAILAAVIYPVMAQSKERARQATCLSNLRQCGMALRMYMDDNGTYIPPTDAVARKLLAKAPTCCQNDKEWTKGCTEDYGPPLIGSYVYTRSVPSWAPLPNEDVDDYYRMERWPLMADIFHGSQGIPAPLHAEVHPQYWRKITKSGAPFWRWSLPDRILTVYQDGHAKAARPRASTSTHFTVLTWEVVMLIPDVAYHNKSKGIK